MQHFVVNGGAGNVFVVCNPPSVTVFPPGTTTVTCSATDVVGHRATCSFNVTVNDTEPPKGNCVAVRPNKIFQDALSKVGEFQLLAPDNCDPDPRIYLADSGSSVVAGPFHNFDLV